MAMQMSCDQSITSFEGSVVIFIFIIVFLLLSYFVLDLGFAAVGLDLVSFLSMHSKTSSKPCIDLSTTIGPAFKLYLLVLF